MYQRFETDSVLARVKSEVERRVRDVLEEAGEAFKTKARDECPVSAINTKGYVHLRDTIDYNVSQLTSYGTMELNLFVTKSYAEYVNNGTSRMPARPFFTDGVNEVQEQWDDVVERVFAQLRAGQVPQR